MPFALPRATRPLILFCSLALIVGLSACQSREERQLRTELRQAVREEWNEKTVQLARRILQSSPRDEGVRTELVRAEIRLHNLGAANQDLADWRAARPDSSWKFDEILGDVALAKEDSSGAVEAWSKALTKKPKNFSLLEKLARLHRQQNQWPQEDAALSAMLAIKDDATARIERALSRRRRHRWVEALEDSRRAQELAPNDPDVRRGAKVFERLGKFLAEIRELDARLAMTPEDDQLLADRALFFLRGQDHELALIDAEAAAQKAPGSVRPRLFSAIALIELGRAAECEKLRVDPRIRFAALTLEFLETVSRLDAEISVERDNAELYVSRAWQLNEIGQPKLALEDAETASRNDANSATAQVEASYALTKLERKDEALQHITRATELDPKLANAWQYRGELEMARDDYPAAIASLTHALASTQTAAALQKREQCYIKLGQYQSAEEDHRALEKLK